MNVEIFKAKAFAKTIEGGNPAGIVLNADSLTIEEKKQIAKEIGFSETAFIQKSNKADFKVEFFTPVEEVDLCGHATIASFSCMFQKEILKPGKYSQETKAGILEIEIDNEGFVFMDQKLPEFSETITIKEITEALIIDQTQLIQGLMPQVVSTGLRDIIIGLNTRKDLLSLKPNFEKIQSLSKKYNAVGLHVFTLETIDMVSIAHSRNFAPLYGVNEESATGTANGALACYLFQNGLINSSQNIVIEQGYSMNMPSEIFVGLEINNRKISRVQVGGKAMF